MKRCKFLFGIIAFIVIIGLALSGCDVAEETFLTVINQNDYTITGVNGFEPDGRDNLIEVNIKKGESKTFSMEKYFYDRPATISIYLYGEFANPNTRRGGNFIFYGGQTTTITLTEYGILESKNKVGD